MNNWWEIGLQIFTTLIGLIGGGVGIMYWRENKSLKQAEVKDKIAEIEGKQALEWSKLYDEERKKNAEKSARLRELYAERDSLKEDNNKKAFRIEQLCWYHCTVNGCAKRRPPHKFDEDGTEVAPSCEKSTRE